MSRRDKGKKRFLGGEERARKPGRIKRLWRIAKLLIVVIVIAWAAAAYHMNRLDRMIEAKFDRPRKWDLPSRVYSDAEYLYPGQDLKARGIAEKLGRLGYRDMGDQIAGPGDYSMAPGRLDIHLHDFDYPDEAFKGFPVRLSLDGGIIREISRLDGRGGEMGVVRLEPEEIAAIFNAAMEDRTPVQLDEVPPHLIEAIILIEDERFLEHRGIDPVGIARAALANLSSGRIVQGGSTLTQQLVKNFFLTSKRSIARKLNEMLIAYRIEKNHTKAEILEAYLNEIYLGQRGPSSVSGVEEASRLYFAKGVGQITLGESALLAGMIRSPSEYSPISKPDNAKARRDFVLKRMLEADLVTKDEFASALAERIVTPDHKVRATAAPYFIDFVKRQISELYPQEILQAEGLKIFTTLDMRSQIAAERAVAEEVALIEKRNAGILPKDHAGMLEACLVSIQPSTGFVRALVGGRSYAASQFDRCTQAARQPGSTFKPFVYLTAVDPRRSDRPFTPASIVADLAFEVESGGKMWSPKNYDKGEHGPVTLATALAQSMNIATARLAIEAGLSNVVGTARDAGIKSELKALPSLALGAFEVSPMEMASAYTIFPNGGIRAEPIAIINMMAKDGQILEKKSLQMKRAFDAAPAYIVTTMMKGVMDRGTGASARTLGFTAVAAGKTGTTSNYRDAWFAGFTPSLLALVWVGYDDNAELNMSGARAALPVWTRFMKEAEPAGGGDFPGPSGVVLVKIDPRTGGLTSSSCPGGIAQGFIEGTEPRQTCEETTIQPLGEAGASGAPQPEEEAKRARPRGRRHHPGDF